VWGTGEVGRVASEPALSSTGFQIAAGFSALIGFFISVASMWFMSTTTATTFSLVGSLNKIPIAVLGMLLFNAPMNMNNILSVSVGLLAGVIFVRAKAMEAR
jgi:GDP-mannose transporter